MNAIFSKIKDRLSPPVLRILDRIKDIPLIEKVVASLLETYEKVLASETVNRIQTAYRNLGETEQKVIKVVFAGVGGLFLLMIALSALTYLSGIQEKIDDARGILKEIRHVKRSYKDSEVAIRDLRTKFKTGAEFNLASFLEQKAGEAGIGKIDSFDEKGVQKKEYINITRHLVKVSKVHLRSIVDFIYQIENSEYPLFVTSLKMTRLFSNIKYFNLEIIIAYKVFNQGSKNER